MNGLCIEIWVHITKLLQADSMDSKDQERTICTEKGTC